MTRSARVELMEDGVVVRTLDIPALDPYRATETEVRYEPPASLWNEGLSVRHRSVKSVTLTFYPLCREDDGIYMTVKVDDDPDRTTDLTGEPT